MNLPVFRNDVLVLFSFHFHVFVASSGHVSLFMSQHCHGTHCTVHYINTACYHLVRFTMSPSPMTTPSVTNFMAISIFVRQFWFIIVVTVLLTSLGTEILLAVDWFTIMYSETRDSLNKEWVYQL